MFTLVQCEQPRVQVMPMLRGIIDANPAFRETMPEGSAHAVSGIGAGVLGACCSQPFDTIKTRMQAFISPAHPRHAAYSTLTRATLSIAREDGYAAYMAGIVPRAVRITCASPCPLPVPLQCLFLAVQSESRYSSDARCSHTELSAVAPLAHLPVGPGFCCRQFAQLLWPV